jgi:hypothetical protein
MPYEDTGKGFKIYRPNTAEQLLFWWEKIQIKNDPRTARINGTHYLIGREEDKFKGFGGQTFYIQFFDGRLVKTTNLWCQGEIPEVMRMVLPDNARFVATDEQKPLQEEHTAGFEKRLSLA